MKIFTTSLVIVYLVMAHFPGFAQTRVMLEQSKNGTVGTKGVEDPVAMKTDSEGNIYITGYYSSKEAIFGDKKITNAASCAGYNCYDTYIVKYSSSGEAQWAQTIGDANIERPYDLAVDKDGNVYVTGYFNSNQIVLNGDTILNTSGGDSYLGDIFLVKYDKNGNYDWGKTFGGNNNDQGRKLQINAAGELYLVGAFSSKTITIGTTTLTNYGNGLDDYFVAKFSSSGDVEWVKNIGSSSHDFINNILLDKDENIILVGRGGTFKTYFTNSDFLDGAQGFIVKYDKEFNFKWAKKIKASLSSIRDLKLDGNGYIYMIGSFQNDQLSLGAITLDATGSRNNFLVKYNPDGKEVWAKMTTGTSYETPKSMALHNGYMYVTGYFSMGDLTIDGNTISSDAEDCCEQVYLTKYDTSGNGIWLRKGGKTGLFEQPILSVDANASGVYLSGIFKNSTFEFENKTLTSYDPAYKDIFIAKYNLDGNLEWAENPGGSSHEDIYFQQMDNEGNLYIGGASYSTTWPFGSYNFTNSGVSDMFLLKYNTSVTGIFGPVQKAGNVEIFPNPATGYISLRSEKFRSAEIVITVLNMQGEELIKEKVRVTESGITKNLNTDILKKGVYVVRMEDGEYISFSKLVKE